MIITELNDGVTLDWLAGAVSRAARDGLRLRISQGVHDDGTSFVKFAVGGSMWTPPMPDEAEPAPAPVVNKPALYVGSHGEPVVRPLETHDARAETIANTVGEVPYYGD